VQQPREPWRLIATAFSQRFDTSGARSPDVSAARHPCLATTDDRRRSTANCDRQRFAAISYQKRFSSTGDRRRSAANSEGQRFASVGYQRRFFSIGGRRRSCANSERKRFGTCGHQELVTVCE
jgi:hypothetical protein